jgi:hypothetical protein
MQKGRDMTVIDFPARYHLNGHNTNRIVAVFPESLVAFELPRGATLEDLATRLAYLGERHEGAPLSVTVQRAA